MKQTDYFITTERGKPFRVYLGNNHDETEVPAALRSNTRAILKRLHELLNGGTDIPEPSIKTTSEHLAKARQGVEATGKSTPYIQIYTEDIKIQLVGDPKRALSEGRNLLKLLSLPPTSLARTWNAGNNHSWDYLKELESSCGVIDEYVPRDDYITPMFQLALSGIIHRKGLSQKLLFEHPVLPKRDQLLRTLKSHTSRSIYQTELQLGEFTSPEYTDDALAALGNIQAGPGTYRLLAKSSKWWGNTYFEPSEPRKQGERLLEAFNEAPEIILRMDFGKIPIHTDISQEILVLLERKILQSLRTHHTAFCHYGSENTGNIPLAVVFSYKFKSKEFQEEADYICETYMQRNTPATQGITGVTQVMRINCHSDSNSIFGFRQLLHDKQQEWLKLWVQPRESENFSPSEARRIFNWAGNHIDDLKIQTLEALALIHPHIQPTELERHRFAILTRFRAMPSATSNPFFCQLLAQEI